MPMKVFKMSLLFNLVLFSYTFPFYFSLSFIFHSPISPLFLFSAPLPCVYFMC